MSMAQCSCLGGLLRARVKVQRRIVELRRSCRCCRSCVRVEMIVKVGRKWVELDVPLTGVVELVLICIQQPVERLLVVGLRQRQLVVMV